MLEVNSYERQFVVVLVLDTELTKDLETITMLEKIINYGKN